MLIIIILALIQTSMMSPRVNMCGSLPCFPGVVYVGAGINMITGVQTLLYLAEFSMSKNKTFSMPDGKLYGFPNEINIYPEPKAVNYVSVYDSANRFAEEESLKVKVDAKFGPWLTASGEYERTSKLIKNGTNHVAKVSDNIRLYQIALKFTPDMLTPSDEFLRVIAKLPKDYNYEVYLKYLIGLLGTHIIVSVSTGGHGTVETVINSAFVGRYGTETIKANIGVEFGWFKSHAEFERRKSGLSEEYYNNSDIKITVEGGDPSKSKLERYEEWKASIQSNPVKVGYIVASYTEMITDSVIRANAERAISEYHKNNQKHEHFGIVKDCKHIEYSFQVPPRAISEIGWIRRCRLFTQRVFLVSGADSRDECLASLNYKITDHYGGIITNYRLQEILHSKIVRIYGVGAYEKWVILRGMGFEMYGITGTHAVFADGQGCHVNDGSCTNTFIANVAIPGTYSTEANPYRIKIENCSDCKGDNFGRDDRPQYAMISIVMQKRIY